MGKKQPYVWIRCADLKKYWHRNCKACKVRVTNFRGLALGYIEVDVLQVNNRFAAFSKSTRLAPQRRIGGYRYKRISLPLDPKTKGPDFTSYNMSVSEASKFI